ncbi:MAG TPA: GNAT family N-acetyltransferase [Terriglobales bacterium]|nr:GNAT family N-acetyltransferase [Terriglobales bacterium]
MSLQVAELQWALRVIEQIEPAAERSSSPRGNRPSPKTVHIVDPLSDPRWDKLVASHPRASLFHSSGWLRSLALTYGYRPVAYTTSAPGEPLRTAAVFCEVDSWLTGRRLVSLPFSDHCEWLVDNVDNNDKDRGRDRDDERAICGALERAVATEDWRYVELRPLHAIGTPMWLSRSTVRYTFHALDVRPELETIFSNFHKSSIQRKIRRAEREKLVYREGRSDQFLNDFYRLFRMTRARHRVPPPPRRWFENLIRECGDGLKIRAAYVSGRAVAAIITVRYKDTMMYKYGCSDTRYNRLGSMHLLFWNAIQEAKAAGLSCFDFGRTDADQQGLITFKGRWGAAETVLDYVRYSAAGSSAHLFDLRGGKWKAAAAKFVLSHLPSRAVAMIGSSLYGHVG